MSYDVTHAQISMKPAQTLAAVPASALEDRIMLHFGQNHGVSALKIGAPKNENYMGLSC